MRFEFSRQQVHVGTQQSYVDGGLPETKIYKDGDYFWTLIHTNGRKGATQGEGLKNFGDMLKSLRTIFGRDPIRSQELQTALRVWEKRHGTLAKPFTFYTGDK